MCGICGWVSYSAGDTTVESRLKILESINHTLIPRGPDDQKIWVSQNGVCIFGHTRLLVVDLEGGKQPMTRIFHQNNISYTLTYNGELYNTEDLRKELTCKGHAFEGYGDTEVLLHTFMEWGSECVQHLNGIFAFAIWFEDEIFFARDRLGVKPFFYSLFPNNFIFGSEVKALLEHPFVSRDVPIENIAELFAFAQMRSYCFVPFKDVHELEPGYSGTFSRDVGLKLWQYWNVDGGLTEDSIEEAAAHVNFLLKNASIRQTVSDVPIGTLVSGGIDSCAVTHYVYENLKAEGKNPKDLLTFSLRLPEYSRYFKPSISRPGNDEDFICFMNSKYQTKHNWIDVTSSETIAAIEECTIAKDYPCFGDADPSMLLMMKKIKSFATVVLSGEASDEIFGGYQHIFNDSIYPGIPTGSAANYEALLKDEWIEKFKLRDLAVKRYYEIVNDCPITAGSSKEEQEYRKRIYLMIKFHLGFMLDRKDRLSMAAGVEVRVPFTDHRLVNYAFQLPKHYNKVGDTVKSILRKSLEKEDFPEEIRTRIKSGYPLAVDPTTIQMSRNLLQSILDDETEQPLFRWLDKTKVSKALSARFNETKIFSGHEEMNTCLNLYSINFWLKHYKVVVV